MKISYLLSVVMACAILPLATKAQEHDGGSAYTGAMVAVTDTCVRGVTAIPDSVIELGKKGELTLYDLPYSRTLNMKDWKRLWINTSVLVGAGISTMLILEALPADATAWNKSENAKIPLFKRYWQHVKKGPVWDKDNPVFNYVLHPYAGAAYYMGARSCGFNCWGSFVYSFCISTFFWEYGFEAFNEVPSVQDLIITPVVGSMLGEGFYLIKRKIVSDGYRLWGSKFLGYVVAFLVDPLNETLGYFRGYQKKLARRAEGRSHISGGTWLAPSGHGWQGGISLTYNF